MAYSYTELKLQRYLENTQITIYVYETDADTVDQVSASDYFNPDTTNNNDFANKLKVGDFIFVKASDASDLLYVSGVSPVTTVSIAGSDPTDLSLQRGYVLVGDANNKAKQLALGTTTNSVLKGDGTDVIVGNVVAADICITN